MAYNTKARCSRSYAPKSWRLNWLYLLLPVSKACARFILTTLLPDSATFLNRRTAAWQFFSYRPHANAYSPALLGVQMWPVRLPENVAAVRKLRYFSVFGIERPEKVYSACDF